MFGADPQIGRSASCLEAELIDLELCNEIGIQHPESPRLQQRLLSVGGLGKAVCRHCANSCMIRLAADTSTGVALASTRYAVTAGCVIQQEVSDPTF